MVCQCAKWSMPLDVRAKHFGKHAVTLQNPGIKIVFSKMSTDVIPHPFEIIAFHNSFGYIGKPVFLNQWIWWNGEKNFPRDKITTVLLGGLIRWVWLYLFHTKVGVHWQIPLFKLMDSMKWWKKKFFKLSIMIINPENHTRVIKVLQYCSIYFMFYVCTCVYIYAVPPKLFLYKSNNI